MILLSTWIWKEWRDHRGGIVAFALMAPALIALAIATIPGEWARNGLVPTYAGFAGFAIAALSFGADLVPGELRRGRLGFLARLPGDLWSAFVAKLVFFAVTLFSFAVWTYLCTSLASALFRDGPWFPEIPDKDLHPNGWILLAAASWMFAVSCWLPRGTLAFPAMVLSVAAFCAPVVGAFVMNRGMPLHAVELEWMLGWLALAGVLVAACSFIGGLRHGAPVRRRLLWCVGSAVLAFAPVWGWAGLRVAWFRHLDPGERTFRISACALGSGGRFAFVNGFHECRETHQQNVFGQPFSTSHALVIDLETGAWRRAGDPGNVFLACGQQFNSTPSPYVLLSERHHSRVPAEKEWKDGYTGATGRPLTGDDWKRVLQEYGALDAAVNRETGFIVLPDGRRAWTAGVRILAERAGAGVEELPCEVRDVWTESLGHGFGGARVCYDCTRERSFERRRIPNRVKWIRAGRWILERWNGSGVVTIDFALLDPDTGEVTPLCGFDAATQRIATLEPDGRLVVSTDHVEKAGKLRWATLSLLDPETGESTPLSLPGELDRRISSVAARGFVACGDRMLYITGNGDDGFCATWLGLLDANSGRLRCAGPIHAESRGLLGCPEQDSVVVIEEDRRIVRAWFDGRPTETLFPR